MKIDSHQHFWEYSAAEYGWISDAMAVLKRNFLPPELKRELAAHGLDGCVAVQARQTLAETRWLLALANEHDFIRGVIGWVDLAADDAATRLKELSPYAKLKGIRHILQDEPDDAYMLRPAFISGLRGVARAGLTYDLLIHARHLPQACELAAQLPELKIVLDHIAKPGIADQAIDPWAENIYQLAEFANVFCKLSGLVTEAKYVAAGASPVLARPGAAMPTEDVAAGTPPVLARPGAAMPTEDVAAGAPPALARPGAAMPTEDVAAGAPPVLARPGAAVPTKWWGWRPDDFEPYLDVIFAAFGPERLMFGSDWPVCLLAGDYGSVTELVADYVARHCPGNEPEIFGENAARFYRLAL